MSTIEKNIKPLFKYIGGKTWLKSELCNELNNILVNNSNITTYVEPFAGGLGAFLGIYDILLKNNIKNVILSDINFELITLYENIRNHKEDLISHIISIEKDFVNLIPLNIKKVKEKEEIKKVLAGCETFFKQVRKEFNTNKSNSTIIQSARLIFLQKHSFNGVYRENSKGEYNTPFNWSGNSMLDTIEDRINELYSVLNLFNVTFLSSSYDQIEYSSDKVFYLDPPYANNETIENKYNKDSFGTTEQLDLIQKIHGLNFLYSNHYSELLIKNLELNPNISIKHINRKNIMSANADSRKFDKVEILATNIVN